MHMILSNNRRATTLMAVTAAVVALFLILASTVEAAPGGNGKGKGPDKVTGGSAGGGKTSSTVAIVEEGPYSFGEQITFSAITTATESPWVQLSCSQGGALVYFQAHGLYDSYDFEPIFTLGPTGKWTAGDATCEANLVEWVNGKTRTLATLAFDVQG